MGQSERSESVLTPGPSPAVNAVARLASKYRLERGAVDHSAGLTPGPSPAARPAVLSTPGCHAGEGPGVRTPKPRAPRLHSSTRPFFLSVSPCLRGSMLLVFLAAPASAQTSYPMLTTVYPAGIQRGKTAEVTVTGTNNFAGASGALFEGSGLSAEVVPLAPPKPGEQPPAAVNTITLKVTAAADAPLGPQEFRVLTPRGASTLGQLVVGDEPERN